MVKNWSKIVLVSLLVIAVAAPVFATTARVRSLANTGDYLSDDSNVFRWYSTLPSYANMVQAEIGTWNSNWIYSGSPGGLFDSRALGLNYACGEDGKYGTYRVSLLEYAPDDPGFYLVNPFIQMMALSAGAYNNPLPYSVTPVNKWDLAGGWEIGDNSVVGFSFSRSSTKIEDQQLDPQEEISVSWTTLGFGYTYTNNEDLIFDAAFTFAKAGGDATLTAVAVPPADPSKWEWDKNTGFDIAARLFWDWKDYVTVVPLFEYAQSEYLIKHNGTVQPTGNLGNKNKALMFGAAMDIEVNGSNTVILAAEYNWAKFEPSSADSTAPEFTVSILPTIRLALESQITSWLTTRVGALHRNATFKDTESGLEAKWTNNAYDYYDYVSQISLIDIDNSFEWFLGAGFNVAEWTIDLELAPETPFSLGWWLHGYSAFDSGTTYGPIARISGTYNF
jgi:hypothetical protein